MLSEGLSVGEPDEQLYEMCGLCCDHLPKEKPRYLMGVGTPWNILECISHGVDMFDCVMPTRNGRNAEVLFTSKGVTSILIIINGRKIFRQLMRDRLPPQ